MNFADKKERVKKEPVSKKTFFEAFVKRNLTESAALQSHNTKRFKATEPE